MGANYVNFTAICVWHAFPLNCGRHEQENVFPFATQIPEFKHGDDGKHDLTGASDKIAHVGPDKPEAHWH